jgi:phenylpropionate dioxygenase-like ring-hydroxylating dioxygenase large terminal subunit
VVVTALQADLTQDDLSATLAYFWHPVCTQQELDRAPNGILAVTLLGRELAVADVGAGRVICLADRCLHRSTQLSVGCVDRGTVRCAYHGWRWGPDGRCVEIPSAPGVPIPSRASLPAFEAEVHHGLIWVRLDGRAGLPVPGFPAAEDPSMKLAAGAPYSWPVAAGRRVENFTDLAHFAWVDDGTLGRRDQPVPPIPTVRRAAGALRFTAISQSPHDPDAAALVGRSEYIVTMPATVNIEFEIAGQPGVRRHLWMTASPLHSGACRTFWFVARNDRHDEPDEIALAFQEVILGEDEPVVCAQRAEFPLDQAAELSVRADKVSTEYRRWLIELVAAAREGHHQLRARYDMPIAPGGPSR